MWSLFSRFSDQNFVCISDFDGVKEFNLFKVILFSAM
jgi:hypothetical protein